MAAHAVTKGFVSTKSSCSASKGFKTLQERYMLATTQRTYELILEQLQLAQVLLVRRVQRSHHHVQRKMVHVGRLRSLVESKHTRHVRTASARSTFTCQSIQARVAAARNEPPAHIHCCRSTSGRMLFLRAPAGVVPLRGCRLMAGNEDHDRCGKTNTSRDDPALKRNGLLRLVDKPFYRRVGIVVRHG